MNTFEKIVTAIRPFGYPYEPDVYTGSSEEGWFTYNYADDYGSGFADDMPTAVIASVQVHLFLPMDQNFISLKNAVRKALLQQGFLYPEVTTFTEIISETKKYRHIVFETSILEEDAL